MTWEHMIVRGVHAGWCQTFRAPTLIVDLQDARGRPLRLTSRPTPEEPFPFAAPITLMACLTLDPDAYQEWRALITKLEGGKVDRRTALARANRDGDRRLRVLDAVVERLRPSARELAAARPPRDSDVLDAVGEAWSSLLSGRVFLLDLEALGDGVDAPRRIVTYHACAVAPSRHDDPGQSQEKRFFGDRRVSELLAEYDPVTFDRVCGCEPAQC